jgi:hypothetical protein
MKVKYRSVNGAWPQATLPVLTGPEAVTATKRLWRSVMHKPCQYPVVVSTGHRAGRFPTGRYGTRLLRDDRKRCLVLVVNPQAGWHELVHSLSHRLHRRLHPGKPEHDDLGRHAFVERTMIEHVVNSGWLEGALKRPEKPKVEIDVRQVRRARVQSRIQSWEAKRKRAERALAKLRRQSRYYERTLTA